MSRRNQPSPEQIEHEIAATRADIAATMNAIHQRFSPWHLLTDVVLGARTAAASAARGARDVGGEMVETGSGFASNLGHTIRNNPVPTALLGIGVGWLFLNGRRNEARHGVPARHAATAGNGAWPATGLGRANEAADESTAAAHGTAPPPTTSVRETLAEIGDGVRRAMPDIGTQADTAKARLASAAHTAGDYADRARGVARDGVERAGAAVRDYGAKARAVASETGAAAVRTAADHPLLTAAGLFAVGAGLAALLPRTRREDAWMGASADALRQSARQKGAEAGSQLGDAARSVAGAARSSAEDEGLTPTHAREAVSQIAQSAAEVAHRAGAAARDEVEQRLGHGADGAPAAGQDDAGEPHSPGTTH